MDFFLQIIGKNVSGSTFNPPPNMLYWLNNIQAFYVVCIAIGVFFTLICCLLASVHLYFVYNYISIELIQTDMYWLVFMCPIIGLCGAVGMIVPRSATFLYAVALVYFMLCIFISVTLMLTLHGGRKALVKKLLAKNKKINMRIFPLGCCLFCVPKLSPTDKVFRRIEWLVFQSPLLRIFLEILNIIMYMELGHRGSMFFQVTNMLGMVSLFVASWGSYMIIPLGGCMLKTYKFTIMFHIVDTAQLIYSVQKVVFDFCVGVNWLTDETSLTASAKGQFWMSFLLTMEMFIVSLVSTFLFRPSQTAFFDKFSQANHNRLSSSNMCTEDPTEENVEVLDDVAAPAHHQHLQVCDVFHRPITSESIRSVGQVHIDDSVNGGGNESGIDSASSSSHSTYENDTGVTEETDRIREDSVVDDGFGADPDRVNEDQLSEINLDSARSNHSNASKPKFHSEKF